MSRALAPQRGIKEILKEVVEQMTRVAQSNQNKRRIIMISKNHKSYKGSMEKNQRGLRPKSLKIITKIMTAKAPKIILRA